MMLGLSESLSTMLFNFALLGKRLSLHPAKFAVSLVARSNVQVFADPFHVDPVHVIPIAQRIQVSPV